MVYGKASTVVFHLNKYRKAEDLRRAVEGMQYTGGNTNTGKGTAFKSLMCCNAIVELLFQLSMKRQGICFKWKME